MKGTDVPRLSEQGFEPGFPVSHWQEAQSLSPGPENAVWELRSQPGACRRRASHQGSGSGPAPPAPLAAPQIHSRLHLLPIIYCQILITDHLLPVPVMSLDADAALAPNLVGSRQMANAGR